MFPGNARWPGVEAALLGALFLGAWPASAEAPKPETELRATFAETYRTTEPAGRLNAVALLKSAKEPATQQMLYTVLRVEKDVNVRLLAFETLCGYEDPEGKIAHLAAEVFNQEKNRDTRKKMARAMASLRYKYKPLGALCHFLTTLRYALLPDSNDRRNRNRQQGQGGGSSGSGAFGGSGGFSRKIALKTRKYFEEVLQIFNEMAGQHFAAKYETPVEIKKWWKEQGAVFLRKDMERRQAYRRQEQKKQEEQQKQQKRNAAPKGKP